jgi:hypothetical protein
MSSELTLEARVDRLEAALIQATAPTVGQVSRQRGQELFELSVLYWDRVSEEARQRAALDPHDRTKTRDRR